MIGEHNYPHASLPDGVERSPEHVQALLDQIAAAQQTNEKILAKLRSRGITPDSATIVAIRAEHFIDFISARMLTEDGRLAFEREYHDVITRKLREAEESFEQAAAAERIRKLATPGNIPPLFKP